MRFDGALITDYTWTPIHDKKEKMQNKALFSTEDAAITIVKNWYVMYVWYVAWDQNFRGQSGRATYKEDSQSDFALHAIQ